MTNSQQISHPLDAYVVNLQERYRRHMGRYNQIANLSGIPMRNVYKLTQSPPFGHNWTIRTLKDLDHAVTHYEEQLIGTLTDGAHQNHQA